MISVSIVSHRQGLLVAQALQCLASAVPDQGIEVLLTLNVPESLPDGLDTLPFPVKVIENDRPKGFGANHNAAFRQASGEWFCVMNPDIRITDNPFPAMIAAAEKDNAAVVAPAVLASDGRQEDSVRYFPSPLSVFQKLFFGHRGDGLSP